VRLAPPSDFGDDFASGALQLTVVACRNRQIQSLEFAKLLAFSE